MSGRQKPSSAAKSRPVKVQLDESAALSRPRKVMLVDLCPEEKAKIGELMITLQDEKTRNAQLQETLKEEMTTREHCEILIEKLKEEIEILRIELDSNVQMVATLNRELELRREASDRLQEDLKNKQVRRSPTKSTVGACQTDNQVSNREIQTDAVQYISYGTQTLTIEQVQRHSRNNTSSVKSSSSLTPMATFPPYDRTLEDEALQREHSRGALPPLPPLSRNNDPMTFSQLEEKPGADASELAQAWLEMKKWSIRKMKKDIEKSKKKANHTSMEDSMSSDAVSSASRLEPGNERRLLLAIHRLNQQKMSQRPPQEDPPAPQKAVGIRYTEMDDDSLNEMLKSGNFRASRYVKEIASSNQTAGKKKHTNGIDFYDPDLLDLINDLD